MELFSLKMKKCSLTCDKDLESNEVCKILKSEV